MKIEELIAYLRRIQAESGARYVEFGRMDVFNADGLRVAVVR